MAVEPRDLNSLRVEMDLARHPPAPPTTQEPTPGPEMMEEIAEDAGGGGLAGPPVAVTAYPGIQDGSVHLSPPGFTVCESFFDSGVFTCFNPEVVFGTEVRLLSNGSFAMGDDVWCNVTVEDGNIKAAELATAVDAEATVSVHIADIRPDGVKQYHVGAIIVSEGGGGGGGESDSSGITVDENALVGMSLDYVKNESDDDFEKHPYAIRLKRGRLQLVNGVLTIVEVKGETQYIETTPFDNRYE